MQLGSSPSDLSARNDAGPSDPDEEVADEDEEVSEEEELGDRASALS